MAFPAAIAAASRGGAGAKVAGGLDIANKVKDAADSAGMLIDEITVTVRGDKLATKAELYKLAASLAFGQVKTYQLIPPGMIMMENHLHDVCVTFTLRYEQSLTSIIAVQSAAYLARFANPYSTDPPPQTAGQIIARLPVYAGPDNNYTGGDWDFSTVIGSLTGTNPKVALPFNNRSILFQSSTCPDPTPQADGKGTPTTTVIRSPNPRPMGDLRTRGSLVSLVTAALTNPGSVNLMKMPIDPTITNTSFVGGP